MFHYFKSKLEFYFFSEKEINNKRVPTPTTVDNSFSKNNLFEIVEEDNFIIIDIKKECNLEEYIKVIHNITQTKELSFLPMRTLITEESNLFSAKIKPQKLFLFHHNHMDYLISKTDKKINMSQSSIIGDDIHEIYIQIDLLTRQYKITKYIHDKNHSTKVCKQYPFENTSFTQFCLEKKEALSLVQYLLDDLNKDTNIFRIVDIYHLYILLNLIPSDMYYPVIKDNTLTLSLISCCENNNINQIKTANLQIILNETRESIGQISFDYHSASGFSYGGNVSYDIKPEFQNKHYATKALNLLKNLVKQNEFQGDKDLYIATTLDNIQSQKVAENNHGELIYDGDVPKDEFIYIIDGIKKVKVYRIKI